ncbi:hypothetical protein BGY98DRAFT_928975, partial [Russula aff. rugulosa BPL654]
VRNYYRARESLFRLEASQDTLQKYQPIKPDELKVNKDITEENRVDQGSDLLPWFWRIGGNLLGPPDTWNDEFHRVGWLKARARYERWKEELEIVKHEMV